MVDLFKAFVRSRKTDIDRYTILVVKVYYKIPDLIVNFHQELSIVSTSCPWVSEDTGTRDIHN